MDKIPWGKEATPRSMKMPESTAKGGYSAFSSGPTMDTTPHDGDFHVNMSDMFPSTPNGITDSSPVEMSPAGPPYEIGRTTAAPVMHGDSDFSKLEHKLEHKSGVTDPAGLAAKIGRSELGQAEMTRRSVEGRKK